MKKIVLAGVAVLGLAGCATQPVSDAWIKARDAERDAWIAAGRPSEPERPAYYYEYVGGTGSSWSAPAPSGPITLVPLGNGVTSIQQGGQFGSIVDVGGGVQIYNYGGRFGSIVDLGGGLKVIQ